MTKTQRSSYDKDSKPCFSMMLYWINENWFLIKSLRHGSMSHHKPNQRMNISYADDLASSSCWSRNRYGWRNICTCDWSSPLQCQNGIWWCSLTGSQLDDVWVTATWWILQQMKCFPNKFSHFRVTNFAARGKGCVHQQFQKHNTFAYIANCKAIPEQARSKVDLWCNGSLLSESIVHGSYSTCEAI